MPNSTNLQWLMDNLTLCHRTHENDFVITDLTEPSIRKTPLFFIESSVTCPNITLQTTQQRQDPNGPAIAYATFGRLSKWKSLVGDRCVDITFGNGDARQSRHFLYGVCSNVFNLQIRFGEKRSTERREYTWHRLGNGFYLWLTARDGIKLAGSDKKCVAEFSIVPRDMRDGNQEIGRWSIEPEASEEMGSTFQFMVIMTTLSMLFQKGGLKSPAVKHTIKKDVAKKNIAMENENKKCAAKKDVVKKEPVQKDAGRKGSLASLFTCGKPKANKKDVSKKSTTKKDISKNSPIQTQAQRKGALTDFFKSGTKKSEVLVVVEEKEVKTSEGVRWDAKRRYRGIPS